MLVLLLHFYSGQSLQNLSGVDRVVLCKFQGSYGQITTSLIKHVWLTVFYLAMLGKMISAFLVKKDLPRTGEKRVGV